MLFFKPREFDSIIPPESGDLGSVGLLQLQDGQTMFILQPFHLSNHVLGNLVGLLLIRTQGICSLIQTGDLLFEGIDLSNVRTL